ncbi:hypothetical protein V8G54_012740 [Vigna mungo]|uniref:Uncharacterized protein n=1 Tax=Vigna mungo TaxID=3915 RepID=A0AAQ3S0W9_VIGMU
MSKQDKGQCKGGRVSNVGGVMKGTLQNQDERTQGEIELINGRERNWAATIFVLAQNFAFIAQITPVNADLVMRKLGPMASPPPSPIVSSPWKPARPPPNSQPHHPPSMP